MQILPREIVGGAYASTHSWDLLCDLVDLDNRMAGQDGETEGAELVRSAFEKHGLDGTTVTEFEVPGWWRGPCELTVEHERVHHFDEGYQLVELPGTPSGDVAAEIVDVGHGLPADFEDVDAAGKLVMASSLTPDDHERWVHREEKYHAAANAGAAGFLFRNHVEGCLPPTGGIGSEDGPGPIPAVGVSKEVGDRLVRYCEDGPVEARLAVECRNEPATSRNVEAVLGPGTDGDTSGDGDAPEDTDGDAPEEEVLVTAHVDAHDVGEGANDNGVGTVLVSEVGRLLAEMEDALETRVRCLVFGAEEIGLYGAYHWVETHENDGVKAIVNVDGAGYSRDVAVHTHGFDAIGDVFREVADERSVPITVKSNIRPHSDHWPFVQEGIPGAQVRTESADSGRGWGHTHGDTLDKIDVRDLREIAVVLAAGVVRLAEADRTVEPKSVDEIREATVEQGYEEGMRNSDNWPFED